MFFAFAARQTTVFLRLNCASLGIFPYQKFYEGVFIAAKSIAERMGQSVQSIHIDDIRVAKPQ